MSVCVLCDTLATIRRVSSSACFFIFFFFIHQLVSAEKRSDLSAAVYYKERPLRGERGTLREEDQEGVRGGEEEDEDVA